jgi:hypothetical protein
MLSHLEVEEVFLKTLTLVPSVIKLVCTKINLIDQNNENTKNVLTVDNMNNTSTAQTKIHSCRSKQCITIVRNKRMI